MCAVCWHGREDMRVDTVPDPKIEQPGDVIIQVTSTCICGSDLHLSARPDRSVVRHHSQRTA